MLAINDVWMEYVQQNTLALYDLEHVHIHLRHLQTSQLHISNPYIEKKAKLNIRSLDMHDNKGLFTLGFGITTVAR